MAKSKALSGYSIQLRTKSYIKHFLTFYYGDPVDLSADKELYQNLRRRLSKKSLRFEKRGVSDRMYSSVVEIMISEDDFYRFGWELSNTDIIAFNHDIEATVKFYMRNIISIYETIMTQKEAILLFQERFGFIEDIWSYESIKKDYFRNCNYAKFKIIPKITIELEKIVLEHLSAKGTFVPLEIINHENIK